MTASENEATAKRLKFRELLTRPQLTMMPGGFSPLYARLAQEAGFESFFLAGSQLSMVLYGYPDNGIIGLRDLVDHCRHMAARTSIPILVDSDTGYGNAVNVYYAVQEIVRSGVAALQIEDQEAPKKSGTVAGRRSISLEEAVGKYQAAVTARNEIDSSFVICARCDVLGAEGGSFEEAVTRCTAYFEQGGVDLVWLNSVQSREQLKIACRDIPGPVLTIWGGEGTAPSPEEYEELGVKIALYPTFTSSFAIQFIWQLLNDFRERGPVALAERSAAARGSKWGLVNQQALLGADRIRELEELYLPDEKRRDYESTWGHRTTFQREGAAPKK